MKTTAWLVIEGTRSRYGAKPVNGIKVTKVTQGRPSLKQSEVAIKLSLSLPAAVFERLVPHVEIDVPEDRIVEPEVTVNVDDPGEGGS